jgi:hypothetical protein
MKRMARTFAFATLFLMIVCAVMAEERLLEAR